MYTLLRQRCLRWIGHVHRMDDGRIPKDLLYSELATGKHKKGRPHLPFMDICKRDMNTDNWEKLAANRSTWKSTVFKGLFYGEGKMAKQAAVKRLQKKASQETSVEQQNNAPVFTCLNCGRHCKIGLYSHNRRCTTSSSTGTIPGRMPPRVRYSPPKKQLNQPHHLCRRHHHNLISPQHQRSHPKPSPIFQRGSQIGSK